MLPVTLFWTPAAVPVTFTEKEQFAPAASAAPERLTTPVPAVAVIVPPPQDPLNPLGVETVSPAGSVSLKAMPCSVVAELLFRRLNVKLVEPFSGIVAAPNDLVKLVGGLTTAMLAVAVLLDPPLVEVACTLLTAEPATVPVTFTVKVQVAPGERLTPVEAHAPASGYRGSRPTALVVQTVGCGYHHADAGGQRVRKRNPAQSHISVCAGKRERQ